VKHDAITGLVLAGGAGRRAGGLDKGLVNWRGRPLVEHVVTRFAPQVDRLIISCNRNRDRYAQYASCVIADERDGFQGPLAGFEAAAPLVATDYLVVVACDLPLLPLNLASRLVDRLSRQPGAAVAHATSNGTHHYLCAALRTGHLASLGPFLDGGGRAVREWYRQQGAISVEFANCGDAFSNINEPIRVP
jgi:molybdopterin-guanine dinucleotide biosynthesis protein A